MWAHIVLVNLVVGNDWGVGLLESTHDLLSVSDLSVEALHLVVVSFAFDAGLVLRVL